MVIPDTRNAYLFTADNGAELGLYALHGGAQWGWADNFRGPINVNDRRAPVALTYSDDRGVNVHVFTVARRNDGGYALFQTHQILGNDWEAWQDFGAPPNEPPLPCEAAEGAVGGITGFVSGGAFKMTSACVWRDAEGLRIDLFGHSDFVLAKDVIAAAAGYTVSGAGFGSLVHFSWKGGDWQSG